MKITAPATLAIDFDGTMTTHKYPRIGDPVPHALDVVLELKAIGHKIILWTCRNGMELLEAVDYMTSNGVILYGVNENPDFKGIANPLSNKAFANIYVDDAALGAPLLYLEGEKRPVVDWLKVRMLFQQMGVLP